MATVGIEAARGGNGADSAGSNGLRVQPTFCPVDVASPFETVEWERRSAKIADENGQLLFEQQF